MRARPKSARAASRSRSRAASGASVATTIMQEPSARGRRGRAGRGPAGAEGVAAELSPHRHAVHGQHAAEVRLDENAERVAAEALGQPPRRGADAALPAEGHRARARTDRALRHRPARRGPDGREDVLAAHRQGADVVERAVVRLAHERVHRAHVLVAGLGERPGHDRLDRGPDRERVRQHDRRLDGPQLAHLGRARELPERVADEDGSRHLLLEEVAPVGQHGGDAGAHARRPRRG